MGTRNIHSEMVGTPVMALLDEPPASKAVSQASAPRQVQTKSGQGWGGSLALPLLYLHNSTSDRWQWCKQVTRGSQTRGRSKKPSINALAFSDQVRTWQLVKTLAYVQCPDFNNLS